MNSLRHALVCSIAAAGLAAGAAWAQDANGWDRTVRTADYLEPAIPHPQQDQSAQDKLRQFEARTGRKPNILILLVDDMGYGDPGAFGGGEMAGAPTPNIDHLAQEGLKLTSTYTTPLCTPSRAALFTGRIPARSGLTRPLLASDRPTKNPWADEVSAAKLLGENGYVTGLSGKWHIGEAKGMQPQDVGFDKFHGFLSVVSEYTQYMDIGKYPQLMLNPERLATFKSLSKYNAIVEGEKGGDLKSPIRWTRRNRWATSIRISRTGRLASSGTPRRRRSPSTWSMPLRRCISIIIRAMDTRGAAPRSCPTRTLSSRLTTSLGG